MRIRSVLQEYEAKLAAPPASPYPAAQGKAEWKVYGNGTRQGKASLTRLDLPDGATLELIVEKRRIAHLTVQGGKARYRHETERGEDVPTVEAGEVLQVFYAGQLILTGEFYAE